MYGRDTSGLMGIFAGGGEYGGQPGLEGDFNGNDRGTWVRGR